MTNSFQTEMDLKVECVENLHIPKWVFLIPRACHYDISAGCLCHIVVLPDVVGRVVESYYFQLHHQIDIDETHFVVLLWTECPLITVVIQAKEL